jgi:hypothetical protein
MIKINKIKIFAVVFLMFLLGPVFLNPVLALTRDEMGLGYVESLGLADPGDNKDPKEMAVEIISYLITFLGIIAVGIILYGGFIWMTAAGNDDRLAKAKKIIVAGVIGLIIILAAYAIVNFIVTMTDNALEGEF